MDIVSTVAACSLLLNVVIVIMQAKQAAAVAELKVYMLENFVRKPRGFNYEATDRC